MSNLYLGLDGDSIGREIERLIISGKESELQMFSQKITNAINTISERISGRGGKVIFFGGDSILAFGDFDLSFANELLSIFYHLTGRTASIGLGNKMNETYLGLKLAKANGGNNAVYFQMGAAPI